ncbi:mannose-6-phosphate isomerase, type 1 [Longilinea arvoryzae]|uniref:Phosphohexomutase n=1 Tax=Longilinea arvoryzae TaxID=360412 RepID=A0A0S7BKA9_9CHLR|nr:type I phosphomannose isomerase catalytic subunit [Longilinea arvoryzae]GAP14776.1 mannose-6-phosphate isomerase, type 1 [Longilinea arvoryzae]
MKLNQIIQLVPEYRDYVWGGNRLRPGIAPTAEAWIVYEGDKIKNGSLAGHTLAEAALEFGETLLGKLPMQHTGARFPLLIKILDAEQWLSLQVHPNDQQAKALEGPDFFGKTEAWHVLEANEGAQLISGLRPDTSPSELADAVRNGAILNWVQYHTVHKGDSIFIAPGTIHALGPGVMLYEVQQTSDLTYRVYDWDRPQTQTRKLHIDKSLAVIDPQATSTPVPLTIAPPDAKKTLVACPYFSLEYIRSDLQSISMNTRQQSFHALTVIEGQADIQAGDETARLSRFDTVLIPARCGAYTIQPRGSCVLLKSSADGY